MKMWMKAFQLLCAFCGSYGAYLVGVTNGVAIGVNGFFAAYLATLAVARLRDIRAKQTDARADW